MRTLILSFVLLALPAAASAQVCPYGLVAVDAAHCCWPGQAFDPARGTCAGAPQCPAGLAPYGETCIASSAAAQPQPQVQPQVQPDGTLPPPPPPPPVGYQAAPPPAGYQATPPPAGYQAAPPAYGAPAPAGYQVQPQVYGYPVRFESKRAGNEFTVSVDNGVACRTPCELTVPPGRHRVKVEGDARFDDRLNFPASPTTVVIEKRRGGGVALGVVGLAVGIPAAVIGAAVGLVGWAGTESYDYYDNYGRRSSYQTMMYAGLGVAAAGVVLAVVGGSVGFGIAGKNRARFARADASEPETPPVQLVGVGAVPTKGGATVGATFVF